MNEARAKAWETRRAKYGPSGHAGSYSRGTGLLTAIEEARVAMRPFFAERARIRDVYNPARMAVLGAMGVTVDTIGGNCPVQAEGMVDGQPFYFRARGEHWSLEIGPEEDWHGPNVWRYEEEYGSWPDAGWMHEHEALEFIAKAVHLYRDSGSDPKGEDTEGG